MTKLPLYPVTGDNNDIDKPNFSNLEASCIFMLSS